RPRTARRPGPRRRSARSRVRTRGSTGATPARESRRSRRPGRGPGPRPARSGAGTACRPRTTPRAGPSRSFGLDLLQGGLLQGHDGAGERGVAELTGEFLPVVDRPAHEVDHHAGALLVPGLLVQEEPGERGNRIDAR